MKRIVLLKARNKYLNRPGDGGGDEQDDYVQQKQGIALFNSYVGVLGFK